MASAFPLEWPAGQREHTGYRDRARFKSSFAQARDGLLRELRLMGVGDWLVVISTNVELRRDGLPYAGRKPDGSPGVAVYFRLEGKQLAIACDRWDRVEDNMRAVEKTVEALRGIERWGSGEFMRQAFSGFKALPPPDDWRKVLGRHSSYDDAKIAFKVLAQTCHPDHGGSNSAMAELNNALASAREELTG